MGRALHPEDWIAHYRIVSLLGAGGMGEVYRARDRSLERDVALKVLPPAVVTSEERVRRFTQEAKSASSLNHPHIVHIYEIGEDAVRGAEPASAPLHYIAMELVQGETLAAKIHNRKVELKTLLGWLAQAAEGVAKAHAAGIVHRDLKPGNIMVSDDGYAKVLDFGLAKLTEGMGAEPGRSNAPTKTARDATREGMIVGTVGYMAPEQVRGQPVDARADVFAFGCMLYEAVTRRHPFAGESNVETLHRILHDVPEPIESRHPGTPDELRRLIRRCLAKDPNQRPQSMRDLALDLHEIVEEYDKPSVKSTSGSLATVTPLKARIRVAPVLIGLTLAAAAIGALLLSHPGPPRLNPRIAARNLDVPMHGIEVTGLSRDGHWIVLGVNDEQGISHLYLMNSAGGDVRAVVDSSSDITTADMSPDGDHIAYTVHTGYDRSEIRVVPTLGGNPRTIAKQCSDPKWSPDGQRIGYTVSYGQNTEFWSMNPDGSGRTRAFSDSVDTPGFAPMDFVWSPDSKRVAWLRPFEKGTYSEIVVRDLATGREHQLTHDRKIIGSLAWTSRGEMIFSSNRGGAMNVWLMRWTGGPAAQVTRGGGPDNLAGVSADGKSILYTLSKPLSSVGWWNVETGEHGKTTVEDEPLALQMAISPDAKRIAIRELNPTLGYFSSTLVTMSRDGTDRRRIATGKEDFKSYAWSPDGTRIAWIAVPGGEGDSLRFHIADAATGEESSSGTVPTGGSYGWTHWVTPDSILTYDYQGSVWYSVSQRREIGRTNDSVYPSQISGWTAIIREDPTNSNPAGIYVRSSAGEEHFVMPDRWRCCTPSEAAFMYCWPESLGFRRLELPSGRLVPVRFGPPMKGREGSWFRQSRDGRTIFWLQDRRSANLVFLTDLHP